MPKKLAAYSDRRKKRDRQKRDGNYGPKLLPHHAKLLADSAITPEVAIARRYRSVIRTGTLKKLGFTRAQRRVPGLLIPIWDVNGTRALYQLRPDHPRLDDDGKLIKYETVAGSRLRSDVPPTVRDALGDPGESLFITEGARKADSAVSVGLCCIALLGVWGWRGRNEHDGLTVLADWNEVALKDREIYIVYDSDVSRKRSVQGALAGLIAFLESRGAHVYVIYLPEGEGGSKVGLDDYLADHSVEDLEALPCREGAQGLLPTIVTSNRPLRDVSRDTVAALNAANEPPTIFVRSGALARVRTDERGQPIIEPMAENELRGCMTRVADYVRRKGDDVVHVSPPRDVVSDVLACGDWPFPRLEAVVELPIVRPDGSVLLTPGYDSATGLFYVPARGLKAPAVSDRPTAAEITAAVNLLSELIVDFPFVDSASHANALALLLTFVLRPAIAGPVPLALIDKPGPGTGASLLAEVVTTVATGRHAAMMTAPRDEEEWRKKITAALLAGATAITIDNIVHPLASPPLASALTLCTWEDRILGRSERVRLPQRATWMGTGNNIRLGGDMPRRCYWIRMDAKIARPWERPANTFRHPELLKWTRRHRGRLIAAVLALVRGWFAAGCPKASVPVLGGFEDWARTVGGVLAFARVPGFLENREALYEQLDEEGPAWEAFLNAWHRTYGQRSVTVADLTIAIRKEGARLRRFLPSELAEALEGAGSFERKLGKALASRADRIHGALRLERSGTSSHDKVARWKVRVMRDVAGFDSSLRGGSNEREQHDA